MPRPNLPAPLPNSLIEWRQERCCYCGYSLAGHGREGRCPECNESFSSKEVVLFGWSYNGSIANVPIPSGCLWVVALYIGVGGIGSLFSRVYDGAAVNLAIALAIIIALIWTGKNRRPNMQLRLWPQGYGARLGFGVVDMQSWAPNVEATIEPYRNGRYLLRLSRTTLSGSTNWSTVVEFTFLATPQFAADIRALIDSYRNPISK